MCEALEGVPTGEHAVVKARLTERYAGVLDEAQIDTHIVNYIGLDTAAVQAAEVLARSGRGAQVLDIGSGFGTFVLVARQLGLDAIGVEPARFELEFSRGRLSRLTGEDGGEIYREGDGRALPFDGQSFDAVTLWNVLEHVADTDRLLSEAVRVLKPGGRLFVLAPNYAALRSEAHYHVPWLPLLPRSLAGRYLRALGRNPGFFESEVHYVTISGVRRRLRRLSLDVSSPAEFKIEHPESVQRPTLRQVILFLRRVGLAGPLRVLVNLMDRNPLRKSIKIEAVKPPENR
jgi:SAM-dependent methyltransferase